MLQIGSKVTFIRRHIQDGIVEGEGLLRAYGVDHEMRVIGLIEDLHALPDDNGNPQVFNVPECCINPSDAMKDKFRKLVDDCTQVELTANAKIKELTDEANQTLIKMNNEVLGAPVDFAAIKEAFTETEEPAEAVSEA